MSAVYAVARARARTKPNVAINRGSVITIATTTIITASVDGILVIVVEKNKITIIAKSANVRIRLLPPQHRKHAKRNVSN